MWQYRKLKYERQLHPTYQQQAMRKLHHTQLQDYQGTKNNPNERCTQSPSGKL